jgi:hypothetical protein
MRWFGRLDSKAIRRSVFLSMADLQDSINAFLVDWNNDHETIPLDRNRRLYPGKT